MIYRETFKPFLKKIEFNIRFFIISGNRILIVPKPSLAIFKTSLINIIHFMDLKLPELVRVPFVSIIPKKDIYANNTPVTNSW